jgi:hypothetical protein
MRDHWLVRCPNVLIAAVLAAFVIGGQSRPRSPSGALTGGATRDEALGTVDIDDTFAFDAAARFNERVVANVDAIDTSLTTILAGNVAVLVFTIDKIKELARGQEAWAAGMMCLSTLACVVAYMLGFSGRASKRDGPRPRTFIADLLRRPDEALPAAIIDMMTAGEQNLTLRFFKKGLAVLAIVFLLASAIVVAFARAKGNMVY